MLSRSRARALRAMLDPLLARPGALEPDLAADPVRFPRRFRSDPKCAEIAGLLASCLAYGQARVFTEVLEKLFAALGPSPSSFAQSLDPERDRALFAPLSYRFTKPADLAALTWAAGNAQRRHGSLEALFTDRFQRAAQQAGPGPEALRAALEGFRAALRGEIDAAAQRRFGPLPGLEHLMPRPERGGACKRWLLFLRWMVRGGPHDPVDLGLWAHIPASALIVPLDTHVHRVSLRLGLTARRDASLKTALEITESLRLLDESDPLRYDFALCHLGMRGQCPARLASPAQCRPCPLRRACPTGSGARPGKGIGASRRSGRG